MRANWIREPKGNTAVIFVHGLLSNGESGWRHDNGTYWPRLLEDEATIKSVGVYVFTYQTGIFSGSYRLSDVVDALKEHLRLDGVTKCERLIFVCHSMGGILVRKYLVERATELIEGGKEVNLFLVASPSLGSSYADLLSVLARFLGHAQAKALRFARNNDWLMDLDKEFLNLKENRRLEINGKELIEDKSIVLRKFFQRQIVEPFSGARYFGEPLKVSESDHFSISKPESKDAIQHRLLLDFISRQLQIPVASNDPVDGSPNGLPSAQADAAGKAEAEHIRVLQANHEVERDRSFAERYSKAVELLGKRNGDSIDPTSFIGGVYELERIARESPKYHWTIVELLVTVARMELEALRAKPKAERGAGPRVQAIFNALGRRRVEYDTFSENASELALRERVLYLNDLVIQGVSFRSLRFPKGWFVNTEFHNCDFRGAQLQHAVLRSADFFSCIFGDRDKTEVTDCSGADFLGAKFKYACYLNNTVFKDAVLRGVWFGYPPSPTEPANPYDVFLEGADFSGAELDGAYFVPGSTLAKVNFQGATTTNTTLYNVDVSSSLNITEEQLTASWRQPHPRTTL